MAHSHIHGHQPSSKRHESPVIPAANAVGKGLLALVRWLRSIDAIAPDAVTAPERKKFTTVFFVVALSFFVATLAAFFAAGGG